MRVGHVALDRAGVTEHDVELRYPPGRDGNIAATYLGG
jgi:hypothetical protein